MQVLLCSLFVIIAICVLYVIDAHQKIERSKIAIEAAKLDIKANADYAQKVFDKLYDLTAEMNRSIERIEDLYLNQNKTSQGGETNDRSS